MKKHQAHQIKEKMRVYFQGIIDEDLQNFFLMPFIKKFKKLPMHQVMRKSSTSIRHDYLPFLLYV